MVDDMEIYCDLDRAVFEHMDTVGPGPRGRVCEKT